MATLELFFSFLLLLIVFFIPTRASCPPSNCLDGPPVRFPFRLLNLQSSSCGYSAGFDLSCNNQTLQTSLSLSTSADNYIVQRIDYEFQKLYINDPKLCLPQRFLDRDLNLDDTPFYIAHFKKYTFLNCSSQALPLHATSFPVPATSIFCLSDENHTVFAVPSIAYENWLGSTSPSPSPSSSGLLCPVISSVSVPTAPAPQFEFDMFGDIYGGVELTWSKPDCHDCEASGGDCGLNRDTDRIVCSNIPKAKREGLPRSAKYGLIIGVGVPRLLCIIGLASYVCGRIKAYGRSNQPSMDLSTSASQRPSIVIVGVGLDRPTIESYPKTLLGESGRLPKPNDSTCSICLCEYQPKEALRTIPQCNHYFHASCIDEWLQVNATCPVCRNSPDGSSLATPSSSMSSSISSSLASQY